jgi:cation diffusion facilitator CzcD-associated flavoprotein CzcO
VKASEPEATPAAVDVLVIGAGVTGIYQLYRAREAGFSVALVEAGDGVGGVWYWNRYPGARVDSESYTYGYVFSKHLFEDWEWEELFAGQPENERYFNHVVDRFDLRRHITFGAKVTSAEYDASSSTWEVRASDGISRRARFVVAATGVLSVPFYPDVSGKESFRGESHHTGLWPKQPVDFAGKRVAVIGTGSSGIQLIPAIADEVDSLTVYQRTPNWSTPLNNRPMAPRELTELKRDYERIRAELARSPTGFLHPPTDRNAFESSKEERWSFYEQLWNSPGHTKVTSHYLDLKTDGGVNAEWCEFMADKIRRIVADPRTAAALIPDHVYGAKRPPFGTDYYEAYNKPNVFLVDLSQTPITRVTEGGIETADGPRQFDIIVWATGFDFGTGALTRLGVRGRDGIPLEEYWATGPKTYLGVQSHGFPNFFYPGGPHGAAANNPVYSADQVDFITDALIYLRDHDYDSIEVTAGAEAEWTALIDSTAEKSSYREFSFFFGGNIPGKPRRFLLNSAGRPKLLEMIADIAGRHYDTFVLTRASPRRCPDLPSAPPPPP